MTGRWPLNIDKAWLYEQYCVLEKSSRAIAKEVGCTDPTILRYLKLYGISVRPKGPIPLSVDKAWLYEQYCVLEKSTAVIARELGCGHTTVIFWLERYGIPRRPPGRPKKRRD